MNYNKGISSLVCPFISVNVVLADMQLQTTEHEKDNSIYNDS